MQVQASRLAGSQDRQAGQAGMEICCFRRPSQTDDRRRRYCLGLAASPLGFRAACRGLTSSLQSVDPRELLAAAREISPPHVSAVIFKSLLRDRGQWRWLAIEGRRTIAPSRDEGGGCAVRVSIHPSVVVCHVPCSMFLPPTSQPGPAPSAVVVCVSLGKGRKKRFAVGAGHHNHASIMSTTRIRIVRRNMDQPPKHLSTARAEKTMGPWAWE